MVSRILAVAAVALVLGSVPAAAQGRQPQQIVLSPSVLKSVVAHRQKSKRPLAARVGMRRGSTPVATTETPAHSAPTSVRAITKTPARER